MDFCVEFGQVKGIQLFCFKDAGKRCKGDGIVQFENAEQAAKAIANSGKTWPGGSGERWIKITKVLPKKKTMNGRDQSGGEGAKGKEKGKRKGATGKAASGE